MQAWDTGCKGCTTYRPNAVTGSVLSVAEEKPARQDSEFVRVKKGVISEKLKTSEISRARLVEACDIPSQALDTMDQGHPTPWSTVKRAFLILDIPEIGGLDGSLGLDITDADAPEVVTTSDNEPLQPHGDVIYMSEPLDRPSELEGNTYKVKWPDSEHALYITINDIVLGGHRRPFEVFINSKNMEHFAWTVALTRMISAVFRRGGDVSFVVEELKAVFDPRGGAWMGGKYIPSILAAIGGVIEQHMIATGFIAGEGMGLKSDPRAEVVGMGAPRGKACSSCGSFELRMIEGCMTCASCGFSKCG